MAVAWAGEPVAVGRLGWQRQSAWESSAATGTAHSSELQDGWAKLGM